MGVFCGTKAEYVKGLLFVAPSVRRVFVPPHYEERNLMLKKENTKKTLSSKSEETDLSLEKNESTKSDIKLKDRLPAMQKKSRRVKNQNPQNQNKKEKASQAVAVEEKQRGKTALNKAEKHKDVDMPSAAAGDTRKKNQSARGKNQSGKEKMNFVVKKDENAKVRIIPLGGLNEIGKNMTAIECGDDIIVIDCGLAFPDDETPGVDLVIPDVTYLEANSSKLRGIVLTHGHEDHIGAIPYVLRNINTPIYGTKLTVGIVRNKLKEFSFGIAPTLIEVKAGDTIRLG